MQVLGGVCKCEAGFFGQSLHRPFSLAKMFKQLQPVLVRQCPGQRGNVRIDQPLGILT